MTSIRDFLGETYSDKVVLQLEAKEDGRSATVLETAMPAKFYRVVVEDDTDSPNYSLGTGSGDEMKRLAYSIARAISAGILVLE